MSERDVSPSPGGLPFAIKPRLIVIAVIVIALIILIASSFFVVDQTEQAVVLRFGKFSRVAGPGLNFKMPFSIEKNYNVPTQVVQNQQFGFRTERAGITSAFSRADFPEESIMLTGDLNIIDIEWTIQYLIVDPKAWLFKVEDRERTIRDISQSTLNRLVGDRAILDVIGNERTVIEVEGQRLLNERLKGYDLGINVTTVKLRNIVPPAGEVQDAFEDVNKAIQDMNRLINEGKEQYNSEIPRARGEAEKLIQEAMGYAAERVNAARGDVARFNSVLAEYSKNPDVTRTRLYIEMIESVFAGDKGTDLVDRNLDNFIPLKMLQDAAGGGAQ
ncbi:MAG: FtsH protease activity modulator HflK [Spirochaetales bacterium]|nr:FtsH protease activity modulator HflK [Spirochaetales bacterium]